MHSSNSHDDHDHADDDADVDDRVHVNQRIVIM
jgi:hypothetical protein